ncbi:Protein of unknown function [Gryllus bimaculatus]|nr:Protein of unknown function [Gryllus bimaculatus]
MRPPTPLPLPLSLLLLAVACLTPQAQSRAVLSMSPLRGHAAALALEGGWGAHSGDYDYYSDYSDYAEERASAHAEEQESAGDEEEEGEGEESECMRALLEALRRRYRDDPRLATPATPTPTPPPTPPPAPTQESSRRRRQAPGDNEIDSSTSSQGVATADYSAPDSSTNEETVKDHMNVKRKNQVIGSYPVSNKLHSPVDISDEDSSDIGGEGRGERPPQLNEEHVDAIFALLSDFLRRHSATGADPDRRPAHYPPRPPTLSRPRLPPPPPTPTRRRASATTCIPHTHPRGRFIS